MAFTVRVKLNIPQVENTCNGPKQVLHRMKMCKSMQNSYGVFNQHPTYISVNLINVDDLQCIFDRLPVISVINGGHNGTLSLSETANTLSTCIIVL